MKRPSWRMVALAAFASVAVLVAALLLLSPRARSALRIAPGFEPLDTEPRVFYEPGAEEMARQFADALPQAIATIEGALSLPFRSELRVYVPASPESFERHLGMPAATPVRGLALARDVWLSPRAFSFRGEDTHKQALAHELAHLFIDQQVGWLHRVRFVPDWFVEGLADWVSGTGFDAASREEALRALRSGRGMVPDDTGAFPRPKGAFDYGLSWPIFHGQSRMFIEHLHDGREEAFDGLVRSVLSGERFGPAFEEHYDHTLAEEWADFLESPDAEEPDEAREEGP